MTYLINNHKLTYTCERVLSLMTERGKHRDNPHMVQYYVGLIQAELGWIHGYLDCVSVIAYNTPEHRKVEWLFSELMRLDWECGYKHLY